ncbi:hypothetical protein BJ878DRAFT_545629 [Calycina marina]|uniref:T6SS Phospholipase effector Tle1-like catalytic domain-containing protein n=1 Tax=Calycina marina TaxID=1763456 RepID=A0A9P7YXR0_9HELO|nr:hypothetical protein BJ878DRAFT_545629 [Calycina marina]
MWNGRCIEQIVYYQSGMGMGTAWVANVHDGINGRGLARTIRQAYSFISLDWSNNLGHSIDRSELKSTDNSDAADEIVLIGFSRGAFAVRCLAQFIQDVGLLSRSGLRYLPKIFGLWKYATDTKNLDENCSVLESWGELRRVPKVRIQACAVWDTVSAMGMPVISHIRKPARRTSLRLTKEVTPNIRLAIQALALDEARRHFDTEVWAPPENKDQKVVQCWFAGCHADIGGDEQNSMLANICLAWMMGQMTDIVHFDVKNMWTITTTRDWSKPTAGVQELSEPPDRCIVEATSSLTRELFQNYLLFSNSAF